MKRILPFALLLLFAGCSSLDAVPRPPKHFGKPSDVSTSRGPHGFRSAVYKFKRSDGTVLVFTLTRETFRDPWKVRADTLWRRTP